MLINPYAAYLSAIHAALGWLRIATKTQSTRHINTALACTAIARERFAVLQTIPIDDHRHAELTAIEDEAQVFEHVAEMRASIAESRAVLARTAPRRLAPDASQIVEPGAMNSYNRP